VMRNHIHVFVVTNGQTFQLCKGRIMQKMVDLSFARDDVLQRESMLFWGQKEVAIHLRWHHGSIRADFLDAVPSR
jgi:hypothetical protein